MAQTFRVVLTQDKRFDVYDTREFDLALDATFPIGRSSSNAAKPHLMPAKHNAYIESPVVSRSHAILTADARSGVPQVYLTDTGSMHGTFVNGNQLAQNVPKLLLSGDKVQLGADVNRNDNYYMAYEYTFKAELSAPEHFPQGFSVPDSEDEDVDMPSSQWGSQQNPVTLDDDSDADSDAESDHSDTPVDDTTLVEHTASQIITVDDVSYPKLRLATSEEKYSDASDMSLAYDIDAEYEDPPSLDHVFSDSEGEVDFFPTSDDEADSDAEDDGNIPVPVDETELSRANVDEDATMDDVDAHIMESQPQPQTLSPRAEPSARDLFAPELPSFSVLSQSLCNQPADEAEALPLPQQPSVSASDNITFELGAALDDEKPAEDPLTNYAFMETMADMGVPNVFSTVVPEASRMQTPPLGATSDEVITTPPPSRRTGVSITEIIEQQPLTPTSIKSLKRKADVFDDEDSMAVDALAAPEFAASGSQIVNIDLRRPRRQPKSIMTKALKTASYLIPGAAVSFALLANLPDSFFGA